MKYCPTYPALLPVPNSISDNVLNYAGRFRSRCRIPVLTYLHPVNDCTLTRSSQPLVGVRGNRSVQDEKLVAAIFATSKPDIELLMASTSSSISFDTPAIHKNQNGQSTTSIENSFMNAETVEDEAMTHRHEDPASQPTHVYGAQQHNLIVDARPTVNAFAMQAVGMGSEIMDNYKFATKAYLGIENIHVMRDSLNKIYDALKDSDLTPLPPNREQMAKSGWLKHITALLDGAGLIARQIGIHHSHVLLHCSDGWDRTSQLSSLSQLCLDPYYRTLEGFIVLIEKDWLSFGHMFRQRSGFLNSEKWFEVEGERIMASRQTGSPNAFGSSGGGKALENALLSAKGFFNRKEDGGESPVDSVTETASLDGSPSGKKGNGTKIDDRIVTKVKETSPVFHQFLDATYQLQYQHPTRFEFNERFLRRLLYHLYSCQYGTFLYDNEKQRIEERVKERTRSVWDYFLARRSEFLNQDYDAMVNDNVRGKERLLFPRVNDVRWWAEAFKRSDDELSAKAVSDAGLGTTIQATDNKILAGMESSGEGSINVDANSVQSSPKLHGILSQGAAGFAAGLVNLNAGSGKSSPVGGRSKSPQGAQKPMEVEMQ